MPCRYQSWSEAVGKSAASVAVLYSSDYGFSDRLSQTLARGITKTDTAVEMVDVLSVDSQVSPPTLNPEPSLHICAAYVSISLQPQTQCQL